MGLQRFPLSDFLGGWNTRDNPAALDQNESPDLYNVRLTSRNVLEVRYGSTRFDISGWPVGDVVADNARAWYLSNGATKYLMLSINGDVYAMDSAGVCRLVFDGTPGTTWCFEPFATTADFMWMVNGVDPPQVYDGTSGGLSVPWPNAPQMTFIRVWRNRMTGGGNPARRMRLYYSDIGDPFLPAVADWGLNFIDVRSSEDDEDPLVWSDVLADYLCVFKKKSVWRFTDSNTFSNTRIGSPGCEGRFQSGIIGSRVYYFNRLGVYSTNALVAPRCESDKIENYFKGESSSGPGMNFAALGAIRVAAHQQKLFVAIPITPLAKNNILLEYLPRSSESVQGVADPDSGAWLRHSLSCSALAVFRPGNIDSLMAAYSLGASGPHIVTCFIGDIDADGSPIIAYWKSPWRSIISEENIERLRRLNVELLGALSVWIGKDFGPDTYVGTVSSLAETGLRKVRPESRARYHRIMLANFDENGQPLANNHFTVYAVEVAWRGGKEH